MPIYEYACKKCGAEFEVSQRITDEPLKRATCPACEKRVAVIKLISRSSFHLKGSGWYVTDYAKDGKKSSKPDEAKPDEAKPGESKNGTAKADKTKADTSGSTSSESGGSTAKTSDSSKSASPSAA